MIINQISHLDMKNYPTNLTESQWQVITKIYSDERKRKHNSREIFDAIFYLLKTGCQWRMLPIDFAPWNTVYYYYRQWKNNGLIEEIHEALRNIARKKQVVMKAQVLLALIVAQLRLLDPEENAEVLMAEKNKRAKTAFRY